LEKIDGHPASYLREFTVGELTKEEGFQFDIAIAMYSPFNLDEYERILTIKAA
jgi:hypothetical protein